MLAILLWAGLIAYGLLSLAYLYLAISDREFTLYSILFNSLFFVGAIESAAMIWWRESMWTLISILLGLIVSVAYIAITFNGSVKGHDFREPFYIRITLGWFLFLISGLSLWTRI